MLPADKPDDATIENDEALDKWFKDYMVQRARATGGKQPSMSYEEAVSQIPSFQG